MQRATKHHRPTPPFPTPARPSLTRSTGLAAVAGLFLTAAASADPASAPEVATTETPSNSPAPKEQQDAKPLVKKLENGDYQIGKIIFNRDKRSITIPAKTNITHQDTFLEYLLVHFNGEKVHEALLVTEAAPTNLNIALKLLNYKESPELFRVAKEDGTPSDEYPEVPESIRHAARFSIDITWKDKGVERTRPITHWLEHSGTKKHMPDTAWVYNGSYVHNQKFKAQLSGSMVTIFPDPGAIANYPGDDRDDDTIWVPGAKVPREGTDVRLTIKPWKK